jgi:hypothetical protein
MFYLIFLFFIFFGFLLGDQAKAGPKHPAGVPDDFVITPFGYFHPSCVRHLEKGETLLAGGRVIRHADGTFENLPACNYPHYDSRGKKEARVASAAEAPTISHAYVETAFVSTTASSYGELSASCIVPPAPLSYDEQQLYFFPGFESATSPESIIQPVLGWNGGPWTIASWNCCPAGTANESTELDVNTGDTILGTIQSTCGPGTPSCATWNVTTEDVTTGQSTVLGDTPSEGQTFNLAFAGVLEVYNVVQCTDYPPNGSLTYFNVALYDDNFNLISNPGWLQTVDIADTPQCEYGVPIAATQVTLDYSGLVLSASPNSLTIGAGGASGATTIGINEYGSFTGEVALTVSGLPSGVTASFGSNPAFGSSVLTLVASGTAAPGTYTVTVTGTDDTYDAITSFTLVIAAPTPTPTFTDSPTATPTFTASPTFTDSPTFSDSPTSTASPTVTPTWTPSCTWTPSPVIPNRLKQILVYPNPSSGNVWFAFPPGSNQARIEVFSLAGQRVADLEASEQRAQLGFLNWNDQGRMANGIYVVMADVGGTRYFTKLALIRSSEGAAPSFPFLLKGP